MPFTPYHLGPGSLIGLSLFRIFDFPALLIASVIIDIEPFSVLLFNLNYPLHGFFHSFPGGSIVAGFIAATVYFLKNEIKKSMVPLFGVYSHILLDSPLYTDIKPFYPLMINPFYGRLG
ncbi:metal-dependent hydrolase [Candidatus Methanoperedens nitratireducens]|uniref:Membrane-bound metal-dependent hydrolase n=1 Tax=Candidatus Methanoperedens nitratireducens TaxID=1392998 RepID=A0A284VSA7_9EURY|nr:metal-dependent hydrolase [Candidatus Methanoperedens nitroreducens]SNQ62073.1 Membrane-bound metal-dependent hydrolase [Candidatus Methanoperedens nitroreducens]